MKLSVGELSAIDFGSTHRWSVTLDGIGISTGKGIYIPATNVEETINGIGSRAVDVGPATYSIPAQMTESSININFIDDKDYTIHNQLKKWIAATFAQGRIHFSQKKILKVIKYGLKDEIKSDTAYEVLPASDLKFVGDNQPSPLTNSITLLVLNIIK